MDRIEIHELSQQDADRLIFYTDVDLRSEINFLEYIKTIFSTFVPGSNLDIRLSPSSGAEIKVNESTDSNNITTSFDFDLKLLLNNFLENIMQVDIRGINLNDYMHLFKAYVILTVRHELEHYLQYYLLYTDDMCLTPKERLEKSIIRMTEKLKGQYHFVDPGYLDKYGLDGLYNASGQIGSKIDHYTYPSENAAEYAALDNNFEAIRLCFAERGLNEDDLFKLKPHYKENSFDGLCSTISKWIRFTANDYVSDDGQEPVTDDIYIFDILSPFFDELLATDVEKSELKKLLEKYGLIGYYNSYMRIKGESDERKR